MSKIGNATNDPRMTFGVGADGRVVKVLDSQPRDRGFESRHTLVLLCLKSLGKIICTPTMCLEVIVNMQLLACREHHKINPG